MKLEQSLAQAWVRGDRAFIETLLAADCTVTDATGRTWTKDQLIEEAFVRAPRTMDSMEVDDLSVRVIGATAVATGRLRAAGTKEGQPVSTVLRFTDVFQLRDGRWQLVASQDTRIETNVHATVDRYADPQD